MRLERIERARFIGLIDLAPIDVAGVRPCVTHDVFVVGRTAGMLAGQGDDRAVGAEPNLMALQRLLIKRIGREVGMNCGKAG